MIDRPQAITAGKEGVFGLDFWRGDVYRLDPTTLHVAGRLHLTLPFRPNDRAFLPETISLGEGTLWVTSNRGVVARIDPRSLRLIGTAFLEPATLDAVAAGNGAAWAAAELDGVARLDPHTHRVTARVRIERGSHALSVSQTLLGGGKVLAIGNWANGHVATGTNALARIDPKTSQVEGVTLLPGPRLALTLGAGWLWAGRVGGTMVERIDPASGRVAGRIEGRIGDALTIGSGYLWTITRTGTVTRLAPAITSS